MNQQHLFPAKWFLLFAALLVTAGAGGNSLAAAPPVVKHPNLLMNRDEIQQVQAKIKDHSWAARLFQKVRELADDNRRTSRTPREAALVYALTGEKRYGEMVRKALVGGARQELGRYAKLDIAKDSDFGSWGPWATWAWAYDLTYDLYTDDERQLIERLFRTVARTIMEGLKHYVSTPNLVFEKHWKVGLIGYCIGDRELIEWGLNDPGRPGPSHGGFYQVLDTMIKDGLFWGEAPIYALAYDLHGMLALAEAAMHSDGTDLYHYTSKKSGASIKGLIDGYLRIAFPLEKTGVEAGSIRMATFGDGSTSYSPRGELADTFLVNPVSGVFGDMTLAGELEVAYRRYKDPGYAWLISLNPRRDTYIGAPGQGGNRPIWGFAALTHGTPLPDRPTPPPAPCGVYPSQGFAVLRSDESPRYWTAGGQAAVLRLGALVGHGHKDYFHLILHGKGRLLYPDLNVIQYESTALNWTREGIAHNTLLVDHESPRPGPFTTRQDFSPEAKFFALTGSAFEGITQTRALMLTGEYLADVFRAADTAKRERTFDWALHGLGRLYPGNPAAYRPSHALLPFYWWIDQEQGRTTGSSWQADWVQHSSGVTPGLQRFGKEWFEQTAGVRMTMLGVAGTEVYHGDGPLADGPPYHRIDGNAEGTSPLVVARRRAAAATFSAVHEPYEKRPAVTRVGRVQETEQAVGMVVEGDGFSDRVLVAFAADGEQTLRGDGETFTFQDHGYLRVAGAEVTVRGKVTAFRLRAPKAERVVINGKPQTAKRDGEFLIMGEPTAGEAGPSAPDEPTERRAVLHYYFLPEEVHLGVGGEKEVALHLRCVGRGEAVGKLRFVTPKGVRAEPESVDVGRLAEGEEKTVRLHLKAEADTAHALYTVRVEPVGDTPAAASSLPVSVGVVIVEDKRVPGLAQWVVRAPGYTMKVDHTSGVSYYLLDSDGYRRHGRIHNTNACYGIPALAVGDTKWVFRFRHPCQFVWDGKTTLTVGPQDGERIRLRYTFHEDRINLALAPHPPSDPNQEYVMWLGNFDVLGQPRALGTRQLAGQAQAADWFFFPHPVHRQGVLLGLPEKTVLRGRGSATAASFLMKARQEAVLRFASDEEIKALFGG
jgi:hypothetical protein